MTQPEQTPELSANRRDFLKTTAAVSTACWVGNTAVAQEKDSTSPIEKINFGCIGVGGKGSSDTRSASKAGNVTAIVDIDGGRLEKANKTFYKDAEAFRDYREMLDKMGDKIDAVTVSTPDHTHAVASVAAMKMGKHCFVQKPMTWSLGEARLMRELAKEKGLATQMGNQGTATVGLRESVEIIQSGALGDVTEVHVWTNRPVWPQGVKRPEGQEAPESVSWDIFLGPAPYREYSPAYHPFKWRGWLDFGTGALGDMACHTMNMPVMALDLFDPTSVELVSTTGIFENETYPAKTKLKYNFPANDKRGPVTMYWYDGGNLPDPELLMGEKMNRSGAVVVGKDGSLYSASDYGATYTLLPKKQFVDYKKPEQTLPRSPGHFEEFAQMIQGGAPAMSNFEYAGRLTETVLLGNLAVRLEEDKVDWDAKNLKATNVDASKLIMRDYRDGWSL